MYVGRDDREIFKDLGVTQLKNVVDKINNIKTTEPKVVHGNVDAKNTIKDFQEMSVEEKKKNWGAYVQSHLKK